MKILYHHRTRRTGVEDVHISGVINGLTRLNHEIIEVAMVKGKQDKKQVLNKSNGKKGLLRLFAQKAPNTLFRVAEIFYNILACASILAAIKDQHPDILYERYAYFNFSGILVSKLKGIPLILEVNIVTDLKDARKLALRGVARFIEKWVFVNAHAIFVVSNVFKTNFNDIRN